MTSNYPNHKSKVEKEMKSFISAFETYKAFYNLIFVPILNEEIKTTINGYEKNILIILKNSLLTQVYMTVRKLLSVDDHSLPSLYTQYYDDRIMREIASSQNEEEKKKLKEELIKKILPSSHEQYKKLKKFINKTIAHIDKAKANLDSFELDDLYCIYKDVEKAFNLVTLKKEDAGYYNSYFIEQMQRYGNSFFKKVVHGLHPINAEKNLFKL